MMLLRSLWCRLFGHRQYSGWWGDALYGDVKGGYIDGTRRSHYTVEKECGRCGKRYVLARFHGNSGALASQAIARRLASQPPSVGDGELIAELRSHGTALFRPDNPTGLLLWKAAARLEAIATSLNQRDDVREALRRELLAALSISKASPYHSATMTEGVKAAVEYIANSFGIETDNEIRAALSQEQG